MRSNEAAGTRRSSVFERRLGLALLVFAAYFGLALASLGFIVPPIAIAVVWLPAGLLVAVLIGTPRRDWPWLVAAAFAANAIGNFAAGRPFAACLAFATVNCFESVVGAYVVGRFASPPVTLGKLRELLVFVGGAAVLGPAVAATLVAGTVSALGISTVLFSETWALWWISDSSGVLLMGAPILAWQTFEWREARRITLERAAEIVLLVLFLGACVVYVFAPHEAATVGIVRLPFLTVPPLLWGAVRFGVRGASAMALALSLASIWLTSRSYGVFVPLAATDATLLLSIEAFAAVQMISALALAAVIEERATGERSLRKLNLTLEHALEGIGRLDERSAFRFTNPSLAAMLGYKPIDLLGASLFDIVQAEDRGMLAEALDRITAGDRITLEARGRARSGATPYLELVIAVEPGDDQEGAALYCFVRDITERRVAEESIRQALHEKDLLLKEVHHRAKNSLQLTTSLVGMYYRRVADESAKRMLAELQIRIRAMALVHDSLYRSETLEEIDLSSYVGDLTRMIVDAFRGDAQAVDLRVDCESVRVGASTAVTFGIVAGELITNAMKHGFSDGHNGRISVDLRSVDSKAIRLIVQDDGAYVPSLPATGEPSGVGLRLITNLVTQLGGKLERSGPRGALVTVTIPYEEART